MKISGGRREELVSHRIKAVLSIPSAESSPSRRGLEYQSKVLYLDVLNRRLLAAFVGFIDRCWRDSRGADGAGGSLLDQNAPWSLILGDSSRIMWVVVTG